MTKIYDKRTLTDTQAVAICLDNRSCEDVAKDYGVSRATISRIKHGHRYANVTEHIRDRQAFAVKLSDLVFKRDLLLTEVDRMTKQIEELRSLKRGIPDEKNKEEELAKYQKLVHGS